MRQSPVLNERKKRKFLGGGENSTVLTVMIAFFAAGHFTSAFYKHRGRRAGLSVFYKP